MSDKHKESHATLKLHDGTVVHLCDWIAGELCASFVVNDEQGKWDPFSAVRSQAMSGNTKRTVTRVDSNLTRAGTNGLPQDYEALIYRWRATTALPMCEQVERFASYVNCDLVYANRFYAHLTLLDLLRTPAGWSAEMMKNPLAPDCIHKAIHELPAQNDAEFLRLAKELGNRDDTYKLPIRLRENFAYGVTVSLENKDALAPFKRWLVEDQHTTALRLRDLSRSSNDHDTALALQRWADELSSPRDPVFKIRLEGLIKRPTV